MSMYLESSMKWFLHYVKKIRPAKAKSAFVFGHAIDEALNELLKTRNVKKSREIFLQNMHVYRLNGRDLEVETTDLITYSKADLDEELIGYNGGCSSFNRPWYSLVLKGQMIIDAYAEKVLPHIVDVISIQKRVSLKNEVEDEVYGLLDAVVIWDTGKVYLIDNKTSSVKFTKDSVKESNQLALYYYIEKDKIRLDGAGFIVINKNVNKNKVKTCVTCGHVSNGMHKTCNNLVNNNRCCGTWHTTIKPSIDIDFIFDEIKEEYEMRVIDSFDRVNNEIERGEFRCGANGCYSKFGPCPYKKYCETGDMDGLVDLKDKDDK
jgi:hypothetical protein